MADITIYILYIQNAKQSILRGVDICHRNISPERPKDVEMQEAQQAQKPAPGSISGSGPLFGMTISRVFHDICIYCIYT